MKKPFVLLISSLLFISLSGCANSSEGSTNVTGNNSDILKVKGVYIWGPEVREFSPCDGSPTLWAEGDDSVMSEIISTTLEKNRKAGVPWQPVYVEMDIRMLKEQPEGFAESYPAAAEIIRVNRIRENIPSSCHITEENE
ncbi:TPA: hypothetical protein I8Y13_004003 [Raoultella planticola]|nr:hypothetical protein [Raoultella planticola]